MLRISIPRDVRLLLADRGRDLLLINVAPFPRRLFTPELRESVAK